MSSLRDYRGKRDPERTPEPFGGGEGGGGRPIFVVQRHDARRLHYDFRLERDGALASWAVPKGVPLEPGAQHLAVHVEDHPLDYATFEGEIPPGNYGAGTVEIWDHGTYELLEEKPSGGLTVRLHGSRLRGTWTLVPARLSGDPKNWLLLRKREPASAESGSRAGEGRRAWAPMLATLARSVPTEGEWSFEVKWDGYRALVALADGEVTLTSRNGNDLTARFPSIAKAVESAVRTPNAVLDGEICALDAAGRSSFSVMQQGSGPLVLYLFDVLEADGEALVGLPLEERRARLRALVAPNAAVRLSEPFDDGEALYAAAADQGLEGIVAKRAGSAYTPGKRSRDWLKLKVQQGDEFVIVGYTRGEGRRSRSFGSLVLGTPRAGGLDWVGNVGTGFDEAEIERLLERLGPLERETTPLVEVPKMPRVRRDDVVWVEPELVAGVRFAEWTHDGRLRAPVYERLREDETAAGVRGGRAPLDPELRKGKRLLKLSNLDKPFWPEEGISKGDLLAYYRDVASVLVPHLRERPFTMKRYPDGAYGPFFFQKDAPKHMPDWIRTFRAEVSTRAAKRTRRTIDFPLVNDELALLWMVNMGCIDMNPWYSRVDRPDRPDFVLFDLDPSADVGFAETVQVALVLKELLDLLELESFPKTSGSEGMHVLVPIARRHTYDETRAFSEVVAGAIARAHPRLATTEWSKAKRRGVLIDANQNGEGKTIASVYSVRPKPGAPVSTPLRWDEVDASLDPAAFTMDAVLDRVAREGDLHAALLSTRQTLRQASSTLRRLSGTLS